MFPCALILEAGYRLLATDSSRGVFLFPADLMTLKTILVRAVGLPAMIVETILLTSILAMA